MSKHILLLLALTACFLQGCNNDGKIVMIDYIATTSYQVENRSDATVRFFIVYAKLNDGTELSRTVSILPGEKKEVDSTSEMCGKNYMIPEYPGKVLPVILKNVSVDMYADGDQVNGKILDKGNWVFSAEEYHKADYLLVITDELIEQAGYIE